MVNVLYVLPKIGCWHVQGGGFGFFLYVFMSFFYVSHVLLKLIINSASTKKIPAPAQELRKKVTHFFPGLTYFWLHITYLREGELEIIQKWKGRYQVTSTREAVKQPRTPEIINIVEDLRRKLSFIESE